MGKIYRFFNINKAEGSQRKKMIALLFLCFIFLLLTVIYLVFDILHDGTITQQILLFVGAFLITMLITLILLKYKNIFISNYFPLISFIIYTLHYLNKII